MKASAVLWAKRTVSERCSLVIAACAVLYLGWLASVSDGPVDSGGEFVTYLVALGAGAVFLLFSVPAAIAMIFWGGEGFRQLWRRLIDKFLPLATLIGAYILLRAL